MLLALRRDLPRVRQAFEQSIAIGEALAKPMPSEVYVQAEMAASYQGRAEVALRAGNQRGAAALLDCCNPVWRDCRQRCPFYTDLNCRAEAAVKDLSRLRKSSSYGSTSVQCLVFSVWYRRSGAFQRVTGGDGVGFVRDANAPAPRAQDVMNPILETPSTKLVFNRVVMCL